MYVTMQPHREYQRTDADFSNTLKYLVSGKEVNRTVTYGKNTGSHSQHTTK